MTERTRAAWLQEAELLERLGSEWEVGHAGAYCTLSDSSIYHSDCPRVEKASVRGIQGRPMIRFIPADVRAWNAKRTVVRTGEAA